MIFRCRLISHRHKLELKQDIILLFCQVQLYLCRLTLHVRHYLNTKTLKCGQFHLKHLLSRYICQESNLAFVAILECLLIVRVSLTLLSDLQAQHLLHNVEVNWSTERPLAFVCQLHRYLIHRILVDEVFPRILFVLAHTCSPI